MAIDLLYDTVVSDLRKSRNGFYPIAQFNRDAGRAQLDTFNLYFQGYSQTQVLHDALSPFKAKKVFTPSTSPNGLVTLPADYAHFLVTSGITFSNATGKQRAAIRIVNEDELDSALKSQVRPVSVATPIGVEEAGSIQLYPEVAQTGVLQYLRLPKDPLYAYTISGRQPVYDAANSVQLEFGDVYINAITEKIIAYAQRYLDEQAKAG
jgi:hypothetical protein